ncbi:membrane dipeptidase [Simiduia sp. 21SJ11W-1]|uniref:dipeptidase n=1 Tax=Simiduia sp. 21SJ11W-1 TaxID=2909669 RepID=UPI0020A15C11|nr:membrane dipeptidase [Simiduia sp. 21SJ11W-1]UTA48956.1 membrane dipeptidase [Simiduia sp. 21SJ11W-1]
MAHSRRAIIKYSLTGLIIILITAVALALSIGPGLAERSMNKVLPLSATASMLSDEAKALHEQLFIADLHADSLLWQRDLTEHAGRGHVDFPRLHAGNVALQMFTVVTKTPAGLNYHQNHADARDNVTLLALAQRWPQDTWQSLTARALYQAEKLHTFVAQAPGQAMLVRNQAELVQLLQRRAAGEPVVGAMLGTEGSHALDGEIGNIQVLYDAGFRMMSLQHFFDNALGGSLHGASNAGLTDFGRQAVLEMNRLGIMIDVSHSSPAVVRDTLSLSSTPLIVSHTGTHGHCNSRRNIPDTLMQAIANKGGLIGIGYWAGAICDDSPTGIARAIAAAVALLGEDAVALGSDFDGAVATRIDTSQLVLITQALMAEDLPPGTIAKVMGGNQLRFLQSQLPRK